MIIEVTEEAEAQVAAIDAWWKRERPGASTLFLRELADVLTFVAATPSAATTCRLGGTEYRRVLLPRTRNHVYFVVDAARRALIVHAVWGAPKRTRPPLW